VITWQKGEKEAAVGPGTGETTTNSERVVGREQDY